MGKGGGAAAFVGRRASSVGRKAVGPSVAMRWCACWANSAQIAAVEPLEEGNTSTPAAGGGDEVDAFSCKRSTISGKKKEEEEEEPPWRDAAS